MKIGMFEKFKKKRVFMFDVKRENIFSHLRALVAFNQRKKRRSGENKSFNRRIRARQRAILLFRCAHRTSVASVATNNSFVLGGQLLRKKNEKKEPTSPKSSSVPEIKHALFWHTCEKMLRTSENKTAKKQKEKKIQKKSSDTTAKQTLSTQSKNIPASVAMKTPCISKKCKVEKNAFFRSWVKEICGGGTESNDHWHQARTKAAKNRVAATPRPFFFFIFFF